MESETKVNFMRSGHGFNVEKNRMFSSEKSEKQGQLDAPDMD
jgi:hypothetical protein